MKHGTFPTKRLPPEIQCPPFLARESILIAACKTINQHYTTHYIIALHVAQKQCCPNCMKSCHTCSRPNIKSPHLNS